MRAYAPPIATLTGRGVPGGTGIPIVRVPLIHPAGSPDPAPSTQGDSMKRKLRLNELSVTSFSIQEDDAMSQRGTVRGMGPGYPTEVYYSCVVANTCGDTCESAIRTCAGMNSCYQTCDFTCDPRCTG